MRTIYKILLIALVIGLLSNNASAKQFTPQEEELRHFLAVNDVDWNTTKYPVGTLSSVLARNLMYDAYDEGIMLGMVKFYNPDDKVGYYFLYYETNNRNGKFFIDPETDEIYSYGTAKHRLSSGVDLPYTRYYCYIPYENFDGVGEFTLA